MSYLDAIIDVSHHESMTIDFNKLKDSGISAVIHKATQGTYFKDSFYKKRRALVEKAGLLWGAYHFGAEGSSGSDQLKYFLDFVGNIDGVLVSLDYETYYNRHDPKPHMMPLQEAKNFIDAFAQQKGRMPFFYSGNTIREVLGKKKDALLSKCPLWLAGYVSEPKLQLQASWNSWTFWQYQYQPGQKGPTRPIPNYGLWDRNVFDGTRAQLQAIWAK